MILILPLTTMPPLLSLIPSLSMPWTLSYPNPSQHPLPLIPLSYRSSLPYMRIPYCSLTPLSPTRPSTMDIYTSRVAYTSLLLLTLPSFIPSIPLPPLATWHLLHKDHPWMWLLVARSGILCQKLCWWMCHLPTKYWESWFLFLIFYSWPWF